MLTDAEIVRLRTEKAYQRKLSTGAGGLISDLIKSGKGDFKPEVSFVVKAANLFVKSRTIRKELKLCSTQLLERILNRELQWPRKPESVRVICEADKENFVWMRYDATRVEALFGRARDLITDAEYRDLVKSHSGLNGDKNQRLLQIKAEIDLLLTTTLRSIGMRGVFDDLVKLQSEEYYRANEAAIQEKFLGASKGGALGMLPENSGPNNP
jgi:hypothetical protein